MYEVQLFALENYDSSPQFELLGAKVLKKEPFRLNDPRRIRIYEKLLSVGETPAVFYLDACKFIDARTYFQGAVHYIAHAFREIEGSLIELIIDSETKAQIKKSESENKYREKIQSCLRILEVPENDSFAKQWREFRSNDKYKLEKLAHRESLIKVRTIDSDFLGLIDRFDSFLDDLLRRYNVLYPQFLQRVERIILKDHPTDEDVKVLRWNIPNEILFGFFFKRLNNPRFLKPLRKGGFFKSLTSAEAYWLATIVEKANEEDSAIIYSIISESSTDNWNIIEELIKAAVRLPIKLSIKIADEKIEDWLNVPNAHLFIVNLTQWISSLFEKDTFTNGYKLIESILDITSVKKHGKRHALSRWHDGESESNVAWHYRKILKAFYPVVLNTIGIDALLLLCDLLLKAIRIEIPWNERKKLSDRSMLWRPAIEDHEQNLGERIKEALVVAIRDFATQMLEEGKINADALFKHLESYKFPIFKRIILHILREHPEGNHLWIERYLGKKKYFSDPYYRHEYYWLIHHQFNQIPNNLQKRYLGWVTQGPKFKDDSKADKGYKEYWQLHKLHPIKDHLPARWLKRYNQLIKEYKPPENPDFYAYSKSWWGPKAPLSAKQISEMSVDEVIELLREWKSSGNEMDPSPQGLGRALGPYVAQRPAEYAEHAFEFQSLNPTYGRYLLDGLRTACKEERSFDWHPVIAFCKWIVQQPKIEITDNTGWLEEDPGWNYAHDSVVSLIADGCRKWQNTTIPFDLRQDVWACIEPITDDPDPDPKREESYTSDYYNLAINSTRGQALEAVMHYILWCARETHGDGRVDGFLDVVPEAKMAIEKHLDLKQDPSLAVRSLYGFYLPFLWYHDQSWVQKNISRIFPKKPEFSPYYQATWSAYIGFNRVYPEIFNLLRQEYEWAIQKLIDSEKETGAYENQQNLVAHLIQMYLRGFIPLHGNKSLLELFYQKADASLRGYCIKHIGLSFHHTKGNISPEVVGRAKDLWQSRFLEAKENPEENKQELLEFGWWFAGRHFDLAWSLQQLQEVLILTGGKTDMSYLVVDRLSEMFKEKPREVMACFREIVAGGNEDWHYSEHKEKTKAMLRDALTNSDPDVVNLAREVINELLVRRHWEYRELISET